MIQIPAVFGGLGGDMNLEGRLPYAQVQPLFNGDPGRYPNEICPISVWLTSFLNFGIDHLSNVLRPATS